MQKPYRAEQVGGALQCCVYATIYGVALSTTCLFSRRWPTNLSFIISSTRMREMLGDGLVAISNGETAFGRGQIA